jgi:hypothetical protein
MNRNVALFSATLCPEVQRWSSSRKMSKSSHTSRDTVLLASDKMLTESNSGSEDMHISGIWERHNVPVTDPRQYHL